MSLQLRLWEHVEPASSLPTRKRRVPPRLVSRACGSGRIPAPEDKRDLAQLAREALAVQDACNLSGVVRSYARALSRLWAILPGAGTDAINRHPIAQLWADKCASLTGTQCTGWAVEAYEATRQLAGEGRGERSDS